MHSANRSSCGSILLAITVFLVIPASDSLLAGKADVLIVEVEPRGENRFEFTVTIRHADTGWSHYADRWDVLSPSGRILGTRILFHPHVDEQPFSRSHTITIPPGIKTVIVRARDKKHGYGGKEYKVRLPGR